MIVYVCWSRRHSAHVRASCPTAGVRSGGYIHADGTTEMDEARKPSKMRFQLQRIIFARLQWLMRFLFSIGITSASDPIVGWRRDGDRGVARWIGGCP
jgi:uncharacterized protein YaeQ